MDQASTHWWLPAQVIDLCTGFTYNVWNHALLMLINVPTNTYSCYVNDNVYRLVQSVFC